VARSKHSGLLPPRELQGCDSPDGYSEHVKYHWEPINVDSVALFEEGAHWTGESLISGAFTVIHKSAPPTGSGQEEYVLNVPSVKKPFSFGSLEEAKRFVEGLVEDNGNEVEGERND
jgi:hypothetical protein